MPPPLFPALVCVADPESFRKFALSPSTRVAFVAGEAWNFVADSDAQHITITAANKVRSE